MDKLKFRVWDKEKMEMNLPSGNLGCENFFLDLNGNIHESQEYSGPRLLDEEKFICQRFTGLKDKNGKEIFEGDIVNCISYKGHLIARINGKIHYYESYGSYRVISDKCVWGLDEFKYIEVIGNIFENNELLEK